MVSKKIKKNPKYIEEAILSINEILANNKKNMFDNISRINKGEIFVLHYLSMSNGTVIPSEISSELNASTARISALLGALEKKGQIKREIDTSNRRNILVTITKDGRKRAEDEMAKMQDGMTKIFTDMGEEDTLLFIQLTKKFFDLAEKYVSYNKIGV